VIKISAETVTLVMDFISRLAESRDARVTKWTGTERSLQQQLKGQEHKAKSLLQMEEGT
jgi:hypothetical protein